MNVFGECTSGSCSNGESTNEVQSYVTNEINVAPGLVYTTGSESIEIGPAAVQTTVGTDMALDSYGITLLRPGTYRLWVSYSVGAGIDGSWNFDVGFVKTGDPFPTYATNVGVSKQAGQVGPASVVYLEAIRTVVASPERFSVYMSFDAGSSLPITIIPIRFVFSAEKLD